MNKINTLVCLISLVMCQLCVAQTKTWMDFQSVGNYDFQDKKLSYTPSILNWNFHQYKSGWGIWNFNGVSPKSAEALIGPMFGRNVGKLYLEGGLGAGIEFNKKPLRGSWYLYGEHPEYWFLLDWEYGGSGEWYLGFIERRYSNGFRLGLHVQEFAPHGVRVGYKFPEVKKIPLYFYGVCGYDPQSKNPAILFSIRYVPNE